MPIVAETTSEQFEKLPSHAKALINRLRRELDNANAEIADLKRELAPPPGADSGIWYRRRYEDDERLLDAALGVEFQVGDARHRISAMIRESEWWDDGPCLEVRGYAGITVMPTASNVIRIGVTNRK